MKLYEYWRSSAAWRVRWALALKKVPYQSVKVDISAGEHHRVLDGINPLHTIPTLELDDGRVLSESVAILEWLEETHPHPPLLPADPYGRGKVRELVELVNSAIHPLQNTVVRTAISEDPEVQRQWCARWISRGLSAFEGHVRSSAGRFSAGDTLTLADLFLVPQVRNAERHQVDLTGFPVVRRIYQTCLETPEAIATDPERVRGSDAR